MKSYDHIVVRKFPHEYVRTFNKLPQNKIERKQVVNIELRNILKKIKIPIKTLPKNFDSIIFLGYKTNVDLIGSFINSLEYYIGLGSNDVTLNSFNIKSKYDVTCFELKRLFELLSKGDINYFPLLFLPQERIIYEGQEWKRLRANTELFKSLRFPIEVYDNSIKILRNINNIKLTVISEIIILINMAQDYIKTDNIIIEIPKTVIEFLNKIKEEKYKIVEIVEIIKKSLSNLESLIKSSKLNHYINGEKVDKLLTSMILNFNKK